MNIKNILKKTRAYRIYRDRADRIYNAKMSVKNEAFKAEAFDVLRLFMDAMNKENIPCWLEFGTLLGCYREHDFIKHDFDLDTGAWFKDHELIRSVLEKNGFERIRYYYVKDEDSLEECYKHKDFKTTIDVFYFVNSEDLSYCYSFRPLKSMKHRWQLNREQPSDSIRMTFPTIVPEDSSFKGLSVKIPGNVEAHLAATYGDDFMTPIPDFISLNRKLNKTYFSFREKPAYAFLKFGYLD